jgi:hypothetical protein
MSMPGGGNEKSKFTRPLDLATQCATACQSCDFNQISLRRLFSHWGAAALDRIVDFRDYNETPIIFSTEYSREPGSLVS